ncbi:MAG: hypothetical protein EWV84_14105 [Microcystis sp. M_QC_C_20170808_M3Col]|nr:MAG: hypothetical protein EWV84_14105 [Microcystis sp. M_QC_C_20170808_M3Col]
MNLFLEVFLYDKNIITKLVGFCYLDLNDKISDLLRSAFGIAPPHPQKAIALGVPIPSNGNFKLTVRLFFEVR